MDNIETEDIRQALDELDKIIDKLQDEELGKTEAIRLLADGVELVETCSEKIGYSDH